MCCMYQCTFHCCLTPVSIIHTQSITTINYIYPHLTYITQSSPYFLLSLLTNISQLSTHPLPIFSLLTHMPHLSPYLPTHIHISNLHFYSLPPHFLTPPTPSICSFLILAPFSPPLFTYTSDPSVTSYFNFDCLAVLHTPTTSPLPPAVHFTPLFQSSTSFPHSFPPNCASI